MKGEGISINAKFKLISSPIHFPNPGRTITASKSLLGTNQYLIAKTA